MSPTSRSAVYSLLAIVFVLVLGIMTMLGVAYQRHRRLEDQTTDLRRHLSRQQIQIKNLQVQLEDCDTLQMADPPDRSWDMPPAPDSARTVNEAGEPAQPGMDRPQVAAHLSEYPLPARLAGSYYRFSR